MRNKLEWFLKEGNRISAYGINEWVWSIHNAIKDRFVLERGYQGQTESYWVATFTCEKVAKEVAELINSNSEESSYRLGE